MINKQHHFFLILYSIISISYISQQTINGSITHDNTERDYIMYIPSSYNSANPVPLVFCFHGFGSNASINFNYTNFKGIADTAGFIVVHPEGTLLQGTPHWNVGGWTLASNTDDVGFTSALIDTISSNYSINLDRVFSTGMSNGGYMSFLLACQLSDRFAAVASVTGSMTPQTYNACNPQHPTPILQIHGTNDGTVPYNGNSYWTKSIDDVLQYWSSYNNCNLSPLTYNLPDINSSDGSMVEYTIYSGGDNATTTEHFKVIGGDHDWPGVFGNMDINASIEVWKFFSKYDINGAIGGVSIKNIPKNSFKIFPSPAKDFVIVELEFNSQTAYQINSLDGKLVKKGNIIPGENKIDISLLKANSYLIKIGNNSKNFIVYK
jgi:polyhydroxybutyrate depolymerase